MQTKSGNLKKFGLCALIACSIITILVFVVPALANDNCPPPVQVPVVLDGVLYQPDEFNKIHCELNAKGINLGSLINPADGVFYAFASREDLKEFMRQIGYPPLADMIETAETN